MRWQCLEAQLEDFCIGLPNLGDTALVLAPVADHRAELMSIEQQELTQMAEVRQLGFSTGRHCAHLVQSLLNLKISAVGRKGRVPVWPQDCVGSITHSGSIAGALASTSCRGVGVDIETSGRVKEKLYRTLFTLRERASFEEWGPDAATVLFSAKEAGYKAIYPIGQKFIGFQEAEVILDVSSSTFKIRYLGDSADNFALHEGIGYWYRHQGHVLSVFVIPGDAEL